MLTEMNLENGVYMDVNANLALLEANSFTIFDNQDKEISVDIMQIPLHRHIHLMIDLSNSTYLGEL